MTTTQRARQTAMRAHPEVDVHPDVAEKVGREILESRLEPAAWAAALSACEGEHKQAISHYARIRMKSLSAHHRVHLAKVDSFECRRMTKCLGDHTEQTEISRTYREMVTDPKLGVELTFPIPRLSPLWLTILWVGSAGTVATAGRLLSAILPESLVSHLSIVSVLAGLAVIGGALLLHRFLPKHWILQGWNSGMVAACNLVCLCSVIFGTKVITRSMAEEVEAASRHQFSAEQQSAPTARPVKVKTVIIRDPMMVSTSLGNTTAEN